MGFGGVVAAEALVKKLGSDQQITLVSRTHRFLFYPALLRLAFGHYQVEDISFDLREAMLDRRIRFVEGEVARINPHQRQITFAHGDLVGEMPYDFLVLALGRRSATDRVAAFSNIPTISWVSTPLRNLAMPCEVFINDMLSLVIVLARGSLFRFSKLRSRFRVCWNSGASVTAAQLPLSSETPDEMFGGAIVSEALSEVLNSHRIEFVSDFTINQV